MKETIENTQKSFDKGLELEKEFCEYLKTDLGWEKARIRSQMASKYNMRGTNVDVIAERIDERGNKLKKLGAFYIVFFLILVFVAIMTDDNETQNWLLIMAVIFELVGAFAFYYSVSLNKENAWVECKNLKTKVSISQVQKAIDEFNHYKQSNNKEYKFTEMHFVSSIGFIENALKLAEDNNVICFTKENGVFKKIDYWNH